MYNRFIEIKLPKATAFLTQEEIHKLLMSYPVIYKESLKRGKYIMRNRQQKVREEQKYYESK